MVIVMKKLLYGIGVDDTEYQKTKKSPDGKTIFLCQIYRKWQNMFCRCYSQSYKKANPTYDGITVCNEWLKFSNFKTWAESQSWQGCDIDKDLLNPNSKQYSPENCCFISHKLNKFIVDRKPSSAGLPLGVGRDVRYNNYAAYCNNPLTNKKERLGTFSDPQEAHLAWKARKLEFAIELGKLEQDGRVLPALIRKYS